MAFTPKNWEDFPATTTPFSAAAMEDLEDRVTDYTDSATTAAIAGIPGATSGAGTAALRQVGTGALQAAPGTSGADVYVQSRVKVYRSADLSVANNTLTLVTFDSEEYDSPGNDQHSTSSNTSRLTCTKAGVYLIFWYAGWAGNATGYREVGAYKNGAVGASFVDQRFASTGSATNLFATSLPLDLIVSDYLEFKVLQNSGGALNFQGFSRFGWQRLSA